MPWKRVQVVLVGADSAANCRSAPSLLQAGELVSAHVGQSGSTYPLCPSQRTNHKLKTKSNYL